jgi:hypothetical protein
VTANGRPLLYEVDLIGYQTSEYNPIITARSILLFGSSANSQLKDDIRVNVLECSRRSKRLQPQSLLEVEVDQKLLLVILKHQELFQELNSLIPNVYGNKMAF